MWTKSIYHTFGIPTYARSAAQGERCPARPPNHITSARRVAVAQVALEYPGQAGAAFLLPGLVNGYGKIAAELGEVRRRLDFVEGKIDGILRMM